MRTRRRIQQNMLIMGIAVVVVGVVLLFAQQPMLLQANIRDAVSDTAIDADVRYAADNDVLAVGLGDIDMTNMMQVLVTIHYDGNETMIDMDAIESTYTYEITDRTQHMVRISIQATQWDDNLLFMLPYVSDTDAQTVVVSDVQFIGPQQQKYGSIMQQ